MTESCLDLLPYGLGTPNLVELQKGYFADSAIRLFFVNLFEAARTAGFNLRIESAYRPFERQLSIWNRKARGELKLLDANGNPMERPKDEEELMYAILTWSALPGASRHHLGTDLDVVDGNACPPGYEVELTPEECSGMFAKFHEFLTKKMACGESFGFERVFVPNRGKIRPEGWHIAHLPTSRKRLEHFSLKTLASIYERSDMACKKVVLARLNKLADEYIFPYFV